jgi:precorrin-2 dehydrogenase/sirohydrochlorin ferrochelatase
MAHCYPVSLITKDRKCLVIGGGAVAERKVFSLLKSGARVEIISLKITSKLKKLVQKGLITYYQGDYDSADLAGTFLVIGATSSKDVNRRIAADCFERNILVNIVDDPEVCSFFVPAVVKRGSFQIAVSTDGKSPLLARKIKESLQKKYGPEYGKLTDLLGQIRLKMLGSAKKKDKGRVILNNLLDDDLLGMMEQGQWNQARERIINDVYRGGRRQS